jgi:hypothetical protein
MKKEQKDRILKTVFHNLVTFFSVFIIFLAPVIQTLEFQDLEIAGLAGGIMILVRVFMESLFKAFVFSIVTLSNKLK